MSSRYNTFENIQGRARAQRRLAQPPVVATATPAPVGILTAALAATSSAPALANPGSLFTPAQMEAVAEMVNSLVDARMQSSAASSSVASAPMKIGRDNAISRLIRRQQEAMEAGGTRWKFDECGQSAHNVAVTRTLVNNLMGLQPPSARPDEAEQQRSLMEKRVENRFKSCKGKHSGSASVAEVREDRNKKSKAAKRVSRKLARRKKAFAANLVHCQREYPGGSALLVKEFMSDDEDHADGSRGFVSRRFTWRSEKANEFVDYLDANGWSSTAPHNPCTCVPLVKSLSDAERSSLPSWTFQ